MTNSDVIANFINHKKGQTPLRNIINGYHVYKGRTLASDGKSLYNYDTLMAYHSDDGKLYINKEKYSVTTSKIQSQIRCKAKDYTEVTESEINSLKIADDCERHGTFEYIKLANSIAQAEEVKNDILAAEWQ